MSAESAKRPSVATVEETAGAWVARVALGPLDRAEQIAYDSWMASSTEHSEAFDRAITVWQGLHAIAEAPEIIAYRAEALEALRSANEHRWSRSRQWSPWWTRAGLAASLLLVIGIGIWQTFIWYPSSEHYETGVGERRVIVLGDSSRLSLDARTAVDVALSSSQRALILLQGRAKFDVAHDATRPFTVMAANRTVVATGTEFSVEFLRREVRVIVYEGNVKVVDGPPPAPAALRALRARNDATAVPLSSGREFVAGLAAGEPGKVIAEADIGRSLAWEGGQLNFVDEPLPDALERISRYNKLPIVAVGPRAQRIVVNGVFNAGDSDAFIDALGQAYGVRALRTSSRIELVGP